VSNRVVVLDDQHARGALVVGHVSWFRWYGGLP
jgi:hypothetical protein